MAESKAQELRASILQASLQHGHAWFLIDPNKSRWLPWGDVLNCAVLVYIALASPFEIAFLPPPASPLQARFVVNRIVDAIFAADLFLQFVIMYAPPVTARQGCCRVHPPP